MRVSLIDYTGKGSNDPWYAANLLIWTKATRIEMSPGGIEEIAAWPEDKKEAELRYMVNTVPSSHEFCDYTFLIQGVTRAFTHQLVRTRTMSFAQQAMQVADMTKGGGWKYLVGPTLEGRAEQDVYDNTMKAIAVCYDHLVHTQGIKTEDARGVLPTNILTNIVFKANLRTMCDMMRKRASPRNQGEFVDFIALARERLIEVHPWVKLFVDRQKDDAARELYSLIDASIGDRTTRTKGYKLVDQLLTNVGSGDLEREEML